MRLGWSLNSGLANRKLFSIFRGGKADLNENWLYYMGGIGDALPSMKLVGFYMEKRKTKWWEKIKDWRRRWISCLVTCGGIILWPHTREIYLRSEGRQQTEDANDTCGIICTQLSHISHHPSINYVDGHPDHHSWPGTCNRSTQRASAATYPSEQHMLTSSFPRREATQSESLTG